MKRTFRFPILSAVAIDGDTIRCVVDLGFHLSRRVDVRISGWDAPEMSGPSRAAGIIVRDWAQAWLDAGYHELESWELDKFGRVLGEIFVGYEDGDSLGNRLAGAGLVKPTSRDGKREPWTEEELARILVGAAK